MAVSREVRDLVVARLTALRTEGHLTSQRVRLAAAAAGVGESTLWRWLAQSAPADGRRRYELTDADRDALADWRGNTTAAWRARREAGAAVPSLRTFQRAVERALMPGERAALSDGAEGRRRHEVYLRWEATRRNQIWQADHKELPMLVRLPRETRPRKPWVTLFVDWS